MTQPIVPDPLDMATPEQVGDATYATLAYLATLDPPPDMRDVENARLALMYELARQQQDAGPVARVNSLAVHLTVCAQVITDAAPGSVPDGHIPVPMIARELPDGTLEQVPIDTFPHTAWVLRFAGAYLAGDRATIAALLRAEMLNEGAVRPYPSPTDMPGSVLLLRPLPQLWATAVEAQRERCNTSE